MVFERAHRDTGHNIRLGMKGLLSLWMHDDHTFGLRQSLTIFIFGHGPQFSDVSQSMHVSKLSFLDSAMPLVRRME